MGFYQLNKKAILNGKIFSQKLILMAHSDENGVCQNNF
jgi:hypothetical protein